MSDLGFALLAIGAVAAVVFSGAAFYLTRSGRRVPAHIDRAFQLLMIWLMTGFGLNVVRQLLF